MTTQKKKALYESIMNSVAKTIKKSLNESETLDSYNKRMKTYINEWFNNCASDKKYKECIQLYIMLAADFYHHNQNPDNAFKYCITNPNKILYDSLLPLWNIVDVNTKIQSINTFINKTKSGMYAENYDKYIKPLQQYCKPFNIKDAAPEGQNLYMDHNEESFIKNILLSDDFRNVAKTSVIKTLGSYICQPKVLANPTTSIRVLRAISKAIEYHNK